MEFVQHAPRLVSWWSTLDWGNVPTWVGSILTSVSVFLALLILFRDRQREGRKNADSLVVWLTKPKSDRDGRLPFKRQVHVHNTNKLAIPEASLLLIGDDGGLTFMRIFPDDARDSEDIDLSVPGESSFKMKLETSIDQEKVSIFLGIRDPRGKLWIRDVKKNRYISTKNWDETFGIMGPQEF